MAVIIKVKILKQIATSSTHESQQETVDQTNNLNKLFTNVTSNRNANLTSNAQTR